MLAITVLLALPAGAAAGGWATVGLSSTPDGHAIGTPWNVELEILQHGRTPMTDVHPAVTIRAGDESHTFLATPSAGRAGFYRASVAFPHGGRWSYVVDDGFTQRHPYPAVVIGGPLGGAAGSGNRDRGPALERIAFALLAGLAVTAAAWWLAPRLGRRRHDGSGANAALGG